jgi:hypothetical protein
MQPVNRYCRPPAHPTKWTVVVDRPREARALTLFDTQAEVHAEIIRLWRTCLHWRHSRPVVIDQPSRLCTIQRTWAKTKPWGPVLRAPDGGRSQSAICCIGGPLRIYAIRSGPAGQKSTTRQ